MSKPIFNPQRMEIARMRRRIPRRELARLVGVRPSKLARWRAELEEPTARQVRRIATTLDWPLAWFYGDDIDEVPSNIL